MAMDRSVDVLQSGVICSFVKTDDGHRRRQEQAKCEPCGPAFCSIAQRTNWAGYGSDPVEAIVLKELPV